MSEESRYHEPFPLPEPPIRSLPPTPEIDPDLKRAIDDWLIPTVLGPPLWNPGTAPPSELGPWFLRIAEAAARLALEAAVIPPQVIP